MTVLLYAIITLGNTILTGVMSGWLIYYYLPPGASPLVPVGLFGLVVLFSRVSHIAASILIHRFAPRKTSGWLWYLIGGAILMPILFILLWPNETSASLPALFLTLTAFNIASGLHQAGYEALLPALGEKERDAISNARMGFLLLGSILAGLAGPLIHAVSYSQAIWIFSLCSAPFLIIPGFLLMGRLNGETRPLEQVPFLENIKVAWASPAFRAFAGSWALMWLATTFTFETLPYIVTQICRLSTAETAYFYIAPLLVSVLAYPIVGKLTARHGVKTVYRASLLTGAVAMSGLILVNDQIPIPLLAQGLVWIILQTTCLIGAQSLPGAIIAEIIADAPEQQGPLYAFGNLIDQFASGLALVLIPFFLLLGRSATDPLGPLGLRLLAPAGSIFLLTAFFVFGRYKTGQIGQSN